jgi:hypothetical protein
MGKAKAEGKDVANMLLFLDESVVDNKDKFVAFNLRGIKQLRFTQPEVQFAPALTRLSQLDGVTSCKSLQISQTIPKVCTKDYSGSSWPFWEMRGGDWGGSSQPNCANSSLWSCSGCV